MRSIWVKLILIACLLVIVACGNNESASTSEGGSDGPFSFSLLLNLHTAEVPNERLEKLIEEATNTELEIQWVPDNNYGEKMNTAFVTGTVPEVVLVKNHEFSQLREAVRDDQFWEVGPYIDDYENLSKLNDDILENQKVEGKLYSLYAGRPLSRTGIIYRKDWADALGIEAPTTTDEFYEMLRAFTEDDPDGNGKDDTIGLTDRGNLGTFNTVTAWFGSPNLWGEKDGKLLPEFMFPEYKQTMDYFKKIYDNGYINKDAPVTSKADQQEMLKNGTAGAYIGSMADVQGIYDDAKALNPDVEFDVHNYVEGPHGEYTTRSIPGYGSLILFPKSAVENENELKKILEFYDYLMSPEGANLLIWGIEGEHYELVDGKAKLLEENTVSINNEIKPYTPLEIGEPETNGRYEGHYDYAPTTKAYELYKDNNNYLVHNPTIGRISETFDSRSQSLQQIIDDATYQYILGQTDEAGFDAAIEAWKNEGGSDVIDEYNE
ncbi:extracellular solute-binding protein [Aureibacillus halotolerans]|uniref:Putative aldouronate transport system substrate-binding protein n=1 Tax=Aureibacillus halotolerans TaxID=1508390 RepID=A0A4R6UC77_9BACI|nr:extracellular solute-binding protein [Aureibacillus halotolerans]TDQ42609.1 putative aldouronate transport system substrate-binding protein [Aureibacillus halotolerans]